MPQAFGRLFAEDALGQGGLAFPVHGGVGLPEDGVPFGSRADIHAADQPGTGGEPGIAELFGELLIHAKDQGVGSQLKIIVAVGAEDPAELLLSGLAHMAAQTENLGVDPDAVFDSTRGMF